MAVAVLHAVAVSLALAVAVAVGLRRHDKLMLLEHMEVLVISPAG